MAIHKGQRAFTLIELLVVISIIALLSSVVLVALGSARDKAAIGAGNIFDTQTYHAFGAAAVAMWSFDDASGATTAVDSSSNGNNLTLGSNAMISTTKVMRGKSSLYLDGSHSGSVAALKNFSASNGSLTFWIYLTNNASDQAIFADYPNNWFYVATAGDSGLIYFYNGFNNTTNFLTGFSTGSALNKWTHVALSWNGSTIRMYVNGKQQTTSFTSYVNSSLTNPNMFVGDDGYGDYLSGAYLDEMRVYSQSLQTADIEKIYAEGLPAHELATK